MILLMILMDEKMRESLMNDYQRLLMIIEFYYLDYKKIFIVIIFFSQILNLILFLPFYTFICIFSALIMSDDYLQSFIVLMFSIIASQLISYQFFR